MILSKNNSGYTLLEVLTVVAIVGLFAGTAIPQFNKTVGWSRKKSDSLVLENLNKMIIVLKEEYPAHPVLAGRNDNRQHIAMIAELERQGYIDPASIDINALISMGNGEDFYFKQYRDVVLEENSARKPIKSPKKEQSNAWMHYTDQQGSKTSASYGKREPLSPEATEEIADLIFRTP